MSFQYSQLSASETKREVSLPEMEALQGQTYNEAESLLLQICNLTLHCTLFAPRKLFSVWGHQEGLISTNLHPPMNSRFWL